MSAPTTEVEAAQAAVVADPTTATATEEVKQEETADAQLKQEDSAAKTEEPADVKMEDVKEESATKPAPVLKTKAPLKADTSNKKFDPSVLPVTNDPETIRNQFEFYFGDTNLPGDKHMWEITGGPENKPVKVKHICNFGRCKRFQPYEAVVAALKESTLLEVSGAEGEEEVKRKKAYVPTSGSNHQRVAATVYVKGFGDETPTTQIDLEEFFKPYGPVNAIRLRRTDEDYFKGSVYVEFPSEQAAKAFLAIDPPPTYQGHELKIMSKIAYMDEKTQLIKEGKMEPHKQRKKFWEGKDLSKSSRGRGGGRGGGRGRDDRNGDSNDWKKRREHDQRNGHGGRGGRGRGRGGRGRGGRGDRNGRDDRRRDEAAPPSTNNVEKPRINSSAPGDEVKKENGKRARENDDGAATSEPPAKKTNTGGDAAAAPVGGSE